MKRLTADHLIAGVLVVCGLSACGELFGETHNGTYYSCGGQHYVCISDSEVNDWPWITDAVCNYGCPTGGCEYDTEPGDIHPEVDIQWSEFPLTGDDCTTNALYYDVVGEEYAVASGFRCISNLEVDIVTAWEDTDSPQSWTTFNVAQLSNPGGGNWYDTCVYGADYAANQCRLQCEGNVLALIEEHGPNALFHDTFGNIPTISGMAVQNVTDMCQATLGAPFATDAVECSGTMEMQKGPEELHQKDVTSRTVAGEVAINTEVGSLTIPVSGTMRWATPQCDRSKKTCPFYLETLHVEHDLAAGVGGTIAAPVKYLLRGLEASLAHAAIGTVEPKSGTVSVPQMAVSFDVTAELAETSDGRFGSRLTRHYRPEAGLTGTLRRGRLSLSGEVRRHGVSVVFQMSTGAPSSARRRERLR